MAGSTHIKPGLGYRDEDVRTRIPTQSQLQRFGCAECVSVGARESNHQATVWDHCIRAYHPPTKRLL
jgi:hypothetical protein